jgi:hypothetical protein
MFAGLAPLQAWPRASLRPSEVAQTLLSVPPSAPPRRNRVAIVLRAFSEIFGDDQAWLELQHSGTPHASTPCASPAEISPFPSSARRLAVKPFPPRLMKYVSMRMPDCGLRGDALFDASAFAIVEAFLVNNPLGG